MHELSVCRALIALVTEVARKNGASRVRRITLEIGPLSGVLPALLSEAFPIASAGTLAEAACLNIETQPVRVWCRKCHVESEAPLNRLVCAECGDWRTELRSGDALILKSVVLADMRPEQTEQPTEEQGYV